MQSNLKNIDTPVCPQKFVKQFTQKYKSWDDSVVTTKLQETWKINCLALNNAIYDKDRVMKYVVSAPTGSAKTANLITYCSMLPGNLTSLISTNLTDEADTMAKEINNEAGKEIACAYHSKNEIKLDQAIEYQIVIVTHEFYKRNYAGGANWDKLGSDRDLLVIDEALDTMKEISVEDEAIVQAITIFTYLQKNARFKEKLRFSKELDWLKDDLEILKNSEKTFGAGTKLISSDRIWTVPTYNKEAERVGEGKILSLELTRYQLFSEILGAANLDGKTTTSLTRFERTVKYNKILTGIDNVAADKTIKNNLIETINNLNQLRKRQVYITSNDGHKSFNRVTDMMFKKSLVCFDATADINEVYNLRAEHYKDIFKLPRIEGVRDYSNVTMYTTMTRTGRSRIDINVASSVLKSVTLGEKTLIVTHKQNEAFFEEVAKSVYPEKTIAIAHWGAITGLNKWKDFDTCIIVGLNHKSRSYAQNRVIINTLDEKKAFGNEQNDLNNSIESSVILSEIIQAINRIRVRKVTNSSGGCDKANIYITIPHPKYNDYPYKKLIQAQMPNINMTDWSLKSEIVYEGGAGHVESIIDYLEGNLTKGGTVLVKDVRDALGIKTESYRDIIGKDSVKQEKFKKKIGLHGFDIVDVLEEGTRGRLKKKPTKYFHKI